MKQRVSGLFMLWAGLLAGPAWAQTRPLLTGFAPQGGPIGTTLTINGSGFGAGAGQNAVFVGGARATVTAATPTQLTVTVPGGAVAPARLVVVNTATRLRGEAATDYRLTAAGGTLNPYTFQRTDNTFAEPATVLTCADVNADGRADVLAAASVLAGGRSGDIQLGFGTGTGTLQVPPARLTGGWNNGEGLIVEDFTGDGQPDVVSLSRVSNSVGSNNVSLYEGRGSSGFLAPQQLYSQSWNTDMYGLVPGDFNNDGRLDLGITSYSSGTSTLLLLLNQGNGTFVPAPTGMSGYLLAARDITGDGLTDLLGVFFSPGGTYPRQDVHLYARNAQNTGYNNPEITALLLGQGTYFGVGTYPVDFNQDGLLDLIGFETAIPGGVAGPLGIRLRNASNTGFNPPVFYPGLNSVGAYPMVVGDFDGDGFPDVVMGMSTGQGQLLARNDGAGGMVPAGSFNNPNGFKVMAVTDLNNDGRADLISAGTTAVVSAYLNTAAAPGPQNNPPTLNSIANQRMDEDGPDLLVTLDGISNGGDTGQAITVQAVSSNPSLMPHPTISFTSPGATATLRLRPAPNAFGDVSITVTVSDGPAPNGTVTHTFWVSVAQVNDPPTLDVIPDIVLTGPADQSREQITVPLSGISPSEEFQSVFVQRVEVILTGNTTISNNGSISLSLPTGTLAFTAIRHSVGLLATVTVTLTDRQGGNESVTRTFRVYGNPVAGQPTAVPTLDLIANVQADRRLAQQLVVPLTGIGDGDLNQVLPLTVTASSSDPGLVAVGPVSYTSPGATGAVPYTISASRSGTAEVSVTVGNGQPGHSFVTRSFRVTVPAVVTGTRPALASAQPAISLHPNPSRDGQSQLAVSGVAGPATLRVFDALGRLLREQQWARCPAQLPVGLGPAPARGVYFVRLISSQGVAQSRLLVE